MKRSRKLLLWVVCGIACLAVLTGVCIRYYRNRVLYDHQPPPFGIHLYSLWELETMREMAVCTDEEALEDYLRGLFGGGARSREDLERFLALWDALPYLPVLDGRIIWINASYPLESGLGGDFSTAVVATKAANGDWFRLHYQLSGRDAHRGAPIAQSADGRVKVYDESREKHPFHAGDLIHWEIEADGFRIFAVYYAADPDRVVTEEVFADLTVQHIADLS